ncbi:hypothetical protein [Pseudomonas japonica]|uniref:hypothetical protein n=1 Tax=Pseudomonas japonica TaxID=256466 RepID=UPI000694BC10|nr:hypothetical protein [Pseudomonas japonica]
MLGMFRVLVVVVLGLIAVGCKSQQVGYEPSGLSFNDRAQAIEVIEQGFFEDYSKKARPQSVLVTDKVIILSDGIISEGAAFGSAVPIGAGALAVGSSKTVTRDAARRIYLNSIGSIPIFKSRTRSSRYAVIIRGQDGQELGSIRTTSLERAKRFADAVVFVKSSRQ